MDNGKWKISFFLSIFNFLYEDAYETDITRS